MLDIGLGIIWYVVLLFSLTLHEAAHAWAAMRGGDLTAYSLGQMTLDPRPHIKREPFGMVIVPVLFFATSGWMIGWASTPIDAAWAYRHPRRAAWMSLAGPASNFLLALTAALAIRIGFEAGVFDAPQSVSFTHITEAVGGGIWDGVATLLSISFTLNLLLFVFNLIPLPPLDGSGVIGLFVDDDAARRVQEFMRQPMLSFMGIVAAWMLVGPLFGPIHLFALNWLYPGVTYG